ncbi:MAG: hypothetical protein K6G56_07535 [Clostridiales bacterium]|nr:hypothetical protein [Clostridiales bacterium]
MNTLVLFYSLTGRTHYEAKRISEEIGAERYEVCERWRRTMLSAYFFGVAQARKRSFIMTEPLAVSPEDYDSIVLMAPIWGGFPAPAFNSMVREIPRHKEVEVILTSDSGKMRDRAGLKHYLEARGLIVKDIRVIKTEDLMKRERRYRKRMLKAELERKDGE